MNATPYQLQALATHMGLTAVIDASGGYGVVRVIVTNRTGAEVFDPENDAEQSQAVMCWLMRHPSFGGIDDGGIYHSRSIFREWAHDNTPPSLRKAILTAALRMAGEA